jgi:hypothetical protein
MSDQTPHNFKVKEQGTEKGAEKTPAAVKEGGVIATKPNQEIHGKAFAAAHADDKHPSGIMPALHESFGIKGDLKASDTGKKQKRVSDDPHPTRMRPALTQEVEAKLKAEKRAKQELISESVTLMAIDAKGNPAMQLIFAAHKAMVPKLSQICGGNAEMVKPQKSLQEWLNEQGRPTSEEHAQFEAERQAMEGTWLETITMLENGALTVRTWQCLPGGVQAEGNTESAPGDSDYNDFIQRHGPLQAGQSHTLVHKLIDGKWVLVDEEGKAKSA